MAGPFSDIAYRAAIKAGRDHAGATDVASGEPFAAAAYAAAVEAGLDDEGAVGIMLRAGDERELATWLHEAKAVRSLAAFAIRKIATFETWNEDELVNGCMARGMTRADLSRALTEIRAEYDEHTDNSRRVSSVADVYKDRAKQVDEFASKAGHAR